jgi:hypothetical protein
VPVGYGEFEECQIYIYIYIYIVKRNGDNTAPCGSPARGVLGDEKVPSTTANDRPVRYEWRNVRRYAGNWYVKSCVTIVAVEQQKVLHILNVCL